MVAAMLNKLPCLMVGLLLASGACKKEKKPAPATEPPVETAGTDTAAKPPEPATPEPSAEEAEKQKKIAENAEALKEAEADAAKETARFTEDIKKKAAELVAKPFKDAKSGLKAILASPHRQPENAERDKHRHPLETLTFFGIKPTMTVVEVGPGAGWYTEILAPLLAPEGKFVAATYDPNGPPESGRTVYGKRTQMFLAKSPELFGKVELAIINPPDKLGFGPDGSADLVIAMREMHNWQRRGDIDKWLAAVNKVLKKGGKFGVEAHRAAKGANVEESAEKGYLPEEWLVSKVESAGFKLEAKSEVNANKKDTKDYEKGVWTLPPNFAEEDKDREKYAAIGESDRMTLRFVKVGEAPAPAAGDAATADAAKAGDAAKAPTEAGKPVEATEPAAKADAAP
jgi:predicted methyltransferase